VKKIGQIYSLANRFGDNCDVSTGRNVVDFLMFGRRRCFAAMALPFLLVSFNTLPFIKAAATNSGTGRLYQ
jgi:hypothetical protein